MKQIFFLQMAELKNDICSTGSSTKLKRHDGTL
jgi:hypothetical protein